jgi:hypothetical protein
MAVGTGIIVGAILRRWVIDKSDFRFRSRIYVTFRCGCGLRPSPDVHPDPAVNVP